jgi:Ni/Co efflux regulator RcnB
MTLAIMAMAAAPVLAGQTAAGANAQGSQAPPPTVTFKDQDRKVTVDWYEAHKLSLPAGLTDRDQPSAPDEAKFKQGMVLNQAMKDVIKPVPTDLLHVLAPPPGVYRYAIVERHLVLIDDSYRVADLIHLGHLLKQP